MKSKIIKGLELSPNGQPEQHSDTSEYSNWAKCKKCNNSVFIIERTTGKNYKLLCNQCLTEKIMESEDDI